MTSTPETEALENWLRENGGFLHQSICILQDRDASGVHWQAISAVKPGTKLATVPHVLALSYLNGLADDAFPAFQEDRDQFEIEAIGFFYLMAQYINRSNSFWKPYLDTLPSPDYDFTTPLWFDDPHDAAWLEGTDVWNSISARKDIYKQYYSNGINTLKQAGIDVKPYTWNLFRWAVTMFSSRAFVSRSIRPENSRTWTTYESTADGRRQAVTINMSHALTEDLDFPVLFPVLDAANHDHNAKVDWTFKLGHFDVTTVEGAEEGAEVCNNYGPKGNDELLLGYGFCLSENPHDTVAVTLKGPAENLQQHLRNTRSEYFNTEGIWSAEKATFRLHSLSTLNDDDPAQLFHELPEPLLELLLYILRDERRLLFSPVSEPHQHLTSAASQGSRYLPHIARMLVQFLTQKLTSIQSANLPPQPQNRKQQQAAIYRQSQIHILASLISALRTYTRSLIWRSPPALTSLGAELPTKPCLMRLELLLDLFNLNGVAAGFMPGIEANANTQDLQQLRLAGWEEDIWVLLLCYLVLEFDKQAQDLRICQWFRGTFPENVELSRRFGSDAPSSPAHEEANSEQASSLLDIVKTAASTCQPGSPWSDPRWNTNFIAEVGGRMVQDESFVVKMSGDENNIEESRLCLYLHSSL